MVKNPSSRQGRGSRLIKLAPSPDVPKIRSKVNISGGEQ